MSLYGEDGSTGYDKEDLYYNMESFIKSHSLHELMRILADVIDQLEYESKNKS